jgi:hypothetical protein
MRFSESPPSALIWLAFALKKPGLRFEIKDNYLSGDLQFDSGNLYYGKGVIIFK